MRSWESAKGLKPTNPLLAMLCLVPFPIWMVLPATSRQTATTSLEELGGAKSLDMVKLALTDAYDLCRSWFYASGNWAVSKALIDHWKIVGFQWLVPWFLP